MNLLMDFFAKILLDIQTDFTSKTTVCSSCLSGQYQAQNDAVSVTCEPCGKGTSSAGSTVDCSPCGAGKYQNHFFPHDTHIFQVT